MSLGWTIGETRLQDRTETKGRYVCVVIGRGPKPNQTPRWAPRLTKEDSDGNIQWIAASKPPSIVSEPPPGGTLSDAKWTAFVYDFKVARAP